MEQTTQSGMAKTSPVELANRSDLFCILSFLDTKLPNSCQILSFVHSAIMYPNSAYRVYFVKDLDYPANYRAIFGIKSGNVNNPDLDTKKHWVTIVWDGSDPDELCRICDSVEGVDWDHDAGISFGFEDSTVLKYYMAKYHVEMIPDEGSPILQYYLSIEDALSFSTQVPNQVYVKSLEQIHAPLVHQTSRYRSGGIVDDIVKEIKLFHSAGVFLKESDQLVCWVMYRPPLGMGRLFTLEPFRRRGYAKMAICYLSKLVAQSGRIPFCSIITGNTPAINVFESLGFRLLCRRDLYLLPGQGSSSFI